MKSKQQSIFLILPLMLLGACVNPYRTNFNATWTQTPNWVEKRGREISTKPRVIVTDDIAAENWRTYENGYIMIGFSKFDGPDTDVNLAVSEARAVGADLILIQKKYAKTLTETVTVTQWPSSETTDVQEDTDISGGRAGNRQIQRHTEVTTSKSPETVYVPKQVDYYEHSATYWRKLERPLFGAFVQDLPDEQKQKLQSNRGVVIRALMVDSPAYKADLLKGDIITQIDGQDVFGARKFYQQMATKAGRSVRLSLLRGTTASQRDVTLNP